MHSPPIFLILSFYYLVGLISSITTTDSLQKDDIEKPVLTKFLSRNLKSEFKNKKDKRTKAANKASHELMKTQMQLAKKHHHGEASLQSTVDNILLPESLRKATLNLKDIVAKKDYTLDFKNGIVTVQDRRSSGYYKTTDPSPPSEVGKMYDIKENLKLNAISIDLVGGSSKDCESIRGNLKIYCDSSITKSVLQYGTPKVNRAECSYSFIIALNCKEPELGYPIALPYVDLFNFLSNPKEEKYMTWLDYLKHMSIMEYETAYKNFAYHYDTFFGGYINYKERNGGSKTFYQYLCDNKRIQDC